MEQRFVLGHDRPHVDLGPVGKLERARHESGHGHGPYDSRTIETGRRRRRNLFLAAAVGWLPVIYGLQLGQPALLVAAGVAVSCALLWRKQDWAAGAFLAVLVLKPQLALLVPAALLLAGRWRAFAAAAIAISAL